MKNKLRVIFIVSTALLASFAPPALAVPGDLDATFGVGGKLTTSFGSNATAQGVALQSDGKILVAGYANNGSDFVLVRYNADGSLDNSFGGGGRVATDMGGDEDKAYSVAVQGDGRIVVAGYVSTFASVVFAVARYNPDGSLDTTFNGTGKVKTDIFSSGAQARSVAVQGDGKIVVAGSAGADFAVVRYTTTGALDTSFSFDGIVTTDIGSSTNDYGYSVAVQNIDSRFERVVVSEPLDPATTFRFFSRVQVTLPP